MDSPGLTPDIVFIRNVEVNQNKKKKIRCNVFLSAQY